MANTTLTADIVLKESQRLFKNETPFLQSMTRQYDDSYSAHGAKAGDTIRIKKPQAYTYRTGKTVDVQSNTENSVSLARSNQGGVDLKFSSKELTLDISRFSELYLRPALCTIASNVERSAYETAYQSVYNNVTLPTTSIDATDILNAGVKLDNAAAPRGGQTRYCVVNPQGQADLAGATSTVFNPTKTISRQYLTGQMGEAYGFEFAMGQNVVSHTTGTANGSYVTAGAGVEGASTLDVDTGSGTFTKGDVITIDDVYEVNPVTQQSTGKLRNFVITAASAGGTATLAISPSLTTVGAYATIDALPADGAGVDLMVASPGTAQTRPQNMAFTKQAFAFATADLELPSSNNVGKMTGRSVEDGVSIRMVEFYDGVNDDTYVRFDVLWGIIAVQPEHACRIYGIA